MSNDILYNADYYNTSLGELPYDDPAWLPFFQQVADRIVEDIGPRTVLDVGCAMGHLVSALRERGVEAYGIDFSKYAISKVREEHKPFCFVASALDELPAELPRQYDLVITIEVAEHLPEEDAMSFIQRICSYSDDIIFSSTPDDVIEATHLNVQQPEYWLKRLSQCDFFRCQNYHCDYISKQAIRLTRSAMAVPQLVESYERNRRISLYHNSIEKKSLERSCAELLEAKLQAEHHNSIEKKSLERSCAELLEAKLQAEKALLALDTEKEQLEYEASKNAIELSSANRKIEQLANEVHAFSDKNTQLQAHIEGKQGEIDFLIQEVSRVGNEFVLFKTSRGYRLLQKLYRIKEEIIPKGSWRYAFVKGIVRFPRYFRLHNFKSALTYCKNNGVVKTLRKTKEFICGTTAVIPKSLEMQSSLVGCKAITRPEVVEKHTETVDIIICVHNAYEDVKRCIESVFEFTSDPYNIIIVDDGSASQTCDYLKTIAAECPNITLIRHESGHGYTIAANVGLHASTAGYCVLLNSDTIVTAGWLDKMVACAKSDPAIGVVGPLSNTASWQSIPNIFDNDGDWCRNNLPDDYTIEEFAKMVEKYSARLYAEVPLLNGFCLLIAKSTIDSIGYLDEENFGKGFGEEDDFNLRAYAAGIKLAIADDTYIFHAQSKSYTDQKRKALCETSGAKIRAKHGDALLDWAVHWMHYNYYLEGIRARTSAMLQRESMLCSAREQWEGKRILFILPIADAGGGGNVVIQEARTMIAMGIDVWLYNLTASRSAFESAYANLDIPVLYGNQLSDFREYANSFDVICSTLYSSMQYCDLAHLNNPPNVVYYIQDYEPYFFEEGSEEQKLAQKSYTCIPNAIRVTKTHWNANEVKKHHGVDCTILGPSVDIDLFRPRKAFGNNDRIEICAMVRPESPRRAPGLTMDVLRETVQRYGDKVHVSIFGADPVHSPVDRDFFNSINVDFEYTMLGRISPQQMASLLGQCDIFADFSSFQAMGLTAMEAMACGCAVIVPSIGGTAAFAHNRENCLMIDATTKENCVAALSELIEQQELRNQISYHAILDMCQYSPEVCAYKFLQAAFRKGGQ